MILSYGDIRIISNDMLRKTEREGQVLKARNQAAVIIFQLKDWPQKLYL